MTCYFFINSCENIHYKGVKTVITLASFIFLILTALFILQSMLSSSIQNLNIFLLAIIALSALSLLFQIRAEWTDIKRVIKGKAISLERSLVYTLTALTGGTYLTFFLNHSIGMGGVLASSAVGLIAAWAFKKYAAAIYCGSFIGMACSIIFSNPLSLLLASIISGTLFILSSNMFVGFGGKLGFMAFAGTYSASAIIGTPLRTIDPLSRNLYFLVFLFVIIAGMATYFLQKALDIDAVTASALVSLVIALLFPDATHVVVVAAFCATFAGMVSPDRVTTYRQMLFLSILTGMLFVAAFSLFDGSGGKLGAIAFLATVSGSGMITGLKLIRKRLNRSTEKSYSI
jgi:hypothetical protein